MVLKDSGQEEDYWRRKGGRTVGREHEGKGVWKEPEERRARKPLLEEVPMVGTASYRH